MKNNTLQEILKKHKLWIDTDYVKGERANLQGAYQMCIRDSSYRHTNKNNTYIVAQNRRKSKCTMQMPLQMSQQKQGIQP